MSALPAISVIVPTYNRAGALLKKALDSVLAQRGTDFEIVVVDDGSSDYTRQFVAQYDGQVRYLHHQNRGPAAARNIGIRESRHDILAFLDSDDWWHPDKLATQCRAMCEQQGYLISHTDEIWYRRGLLLNQKKKHARPHGDIFHHCLPLCCVGMSTVMARRDFFMEAGVFDESYPCCEDYELWLRASLSIPFLKVDEPLTYKQGGREDQVSYQHRVGMDRFRIRAMEKAAELPSCRPSQRRALAAEIIRKATIYASGCQKHGRLDEADTYGRKISWWRQELAGASLHRECL
ncbi:MAG: glycosyltransferase family 2 protein [Desulfobulbaceae bacterium]|nr:MAG: glycosyltransferase family 2 protein [Desulfobulbaceae bacterium]